MSDYGIAILGEALVALLTTMWWHSAYDRDPEHTYFRDLVRRAATSATGAP